MASEHFTYAVRDEVDHTVVGVAGEIDLANAEDLAKALSEAADREVPVVVDASALEFIDSAGFAAIQRVLERATLYLVVPPDCATARGFGVSGLSQVIPTFPSLAEAGHHLRGQPPRRPG